jgi:hypothetical protein
MSSQKPKKSRILKVQVSFEASRISDECIACAYEQVIPELRLSTRKSSQNPGLQNELIRERVEEIDYFNSLNFDSG